MIDCTSVGGQLSVIDCTSVVGGGGGATFCD